MTSRRRESQVSDPASASSFSLAALAIAAAGPLFGPFALIVFAALSGGLWAVAASHEASRMASAWTLLRCTLLSVVITGGLSTWLQSMYQIPAMELLAPVAFGAAALGEKWQSVFESAVDAIRGAIARFGAPKSGDSRNE